jgi:hypothetical protein
MPAGLGICSTDMGFERAETGAITTTLFRGEGVAREPEEEELEAKIWPQISEEMENRRP